jgi:hypothetical protein
MQIKKIFSFFILLVIGTFVYGQDGLDGQNGFQKIAEIRLYCQLIEQMMPNTGSLAWGIIRQLNTAYDEKLVTVGQDGIKRIGLCQLPEDVVEMFAKNRDPEYPYTVKGSITIVSVIFQFVKMQFPNDQKTAMFTAVWFMLYGMNDTRPLSLTDRNVLAIVDYATAFQRGGF